MEKQVAQTQTKHKSSMIMKLLPKAATSSVSFQNPPQDQKRSSHVGKGFSGPMVSMIPAEARNKPRYGGSSSSSFEYNTTEPTSPKISCMGNIKHKQHIHKMKRRVASTNLPPPPPPRNNNNDEVIKEKKKKKKQYSSRLGNIFMRTKSMAGKSDASLADQKPSLDALNGRAPSLGNMRRFTSGRGDPLANFDWTTARIAPDSEEEEEEEEEDGEVIIPFSTIMIGAGGDVVLEPRKEINLWKRRTMHPPRPLQLHT